MRYYCFEVSYWYSHQIILYGYWIKSDLQIYRTKRFLPKTAIKKRAVNRILEILSKHYNGKIDEIMKKLIRAFYFGPKCGRPWSLRPRGRILPLITPFHSNLILIQNRARAEPERKNAAWFRGNFRTKLFDERKWIGAQMTREDTARISNKCAFFPSPRLLSLHIYNII